MLPGEMMVSKFLASGCFVTLQSEGHIWLWTGFFPGTFFDIAC